MANQYQWIMRERFFEIIDKLNLVYVGKRPMLVQVENDAGDRMCIGIGSNKDSIINFFPFDGSRSKCVEGENKGDEVIGFYMGDDESEFYVYETINYQTALNILRTFLLENILDRAVKWTDD